MAPKIQLSAVDSHTAGEPTRIVISGLPVLRGSTLREKRADLMRRFDHLRRFLTFEPRGHAAMFGAFVVPPAAPEADVGVIFFKTLGYVDMCGHGTIGVTTVLIEAGLVEPREPETTLTIETTVGLVQVRARVIDGRVREVTFRNVPAFLLAAGLDIRVPEVGPLVVDVGYGGNWFAMLPARDVGLSVALRDLSELRSLGVRIRKASNERLAERYPSEYVEGMVDHTMFFGPAEGAGAHGRNVVTSGEERFDRSPCGTGTSARMACLYASKRLKLEEDLVHECILGLTFRGRLIGECVINGRAAVIPEITGSAHITGFPHFALDPDDPLGWGFCTDAAAGEPAAFK